MADPTATHLTDFLRVALLVKLGSQPNFLITFVGALCCDTGQLTYVQGLVAYLSEAASSRSPTRGPPSSSESRDGCSARSRSGRLGDVPALEWRHRPSSSWWTSRVTSSAGRLGGKGLAVAVLWRLGGAAGRRENFLRALGRGGSSVVDVPVILQFQQFFDVKVLQIQFIDRVLACGFFIESIA